MSAVLGADLAADVRAAKARHSGDLIVYGCGELAYDLACLGLVDEVRFWMFPWVWGEGTRAFQKGSPPVRMRLLSTVTYPSGVVRLAYQPLGARATG